MIFGLWWDTEQSHNLITPTELSDFNYLKTLFLTFQARALPPAQAWGPLVSSLSLCPRRPAPRCPRVTPPRLPRPRPGPRPVTSTASAPDIQPWPLLPRHPPRQVTLRLWKHNADIHSFKYVSIKAAFKRLQNQLRDSSSVSNKVSGII